MYHAHDGERFQTKLSARTYTAEEEDIPHREASERIEFVNSSDEEKLDVFEFRVTEHLAAERTVKIKATSKDEARERVDGALLDKKPEVTHTVHKEFSKLEKIDEVPRSKIESGDYYNDG